MKEISEENSASESCDIKNLSQYLITKEQNKALRDSITSIKEELKEERKAFRESVEGNQRPGSESTARRIQQRRCARSSEGKFIRKPIGRTFYGSWAIEGPRREGTVTFEDEENIRQARQEVCSSAVGSSTGLQEVGDWTFWKARPPPKRKEVQTTARDPESLAPCYTRKH
jgi:hypothetical protein